ncbi:hypothetical protein COO60DRAFT_1640359 [Scenedesmus sp. NREL 46B-D3]|nr:hypothetical protein COO60DRAFT_1640359 [Scenedesmus sp. NREL 46B-D3]
MDVQSCQHLWTTAAPASGSGSSSLDVAVIASHSLDDAAAPASGSGADAATLPALATHQVLKRALSEVGAFQLPAQTNRLALLFGPHASPAVCLSFGVEAFEPGHATPLHTHSSAHELFFVLAGRAGARAMDVGDVAVFPPGVLHGVDNESDQQLYCLQMMLPNESFVEWVRSGTAAERWTLQRCSACSSSQLRVISHTLRPILLLNWCRVGASSGM